MTRRRRSPTSEYELVATFEPATDTDAGIRALLLILNAPPAECPAPVAADEPARLDAAAPAEKERAA